MRVPDLHVYSYACARYGLNAHQNVNYCILEGDGSATLFTRPFLPFCVAGAGHETTLL